jgi:hypothetical protein
MPGLVDIQKMKAGTNEEVEAGAALKVTKSLVPKPRLIEVLSNVAMRERILKEEEGRRRQGDKICCLGFSLTRLTLTPLRQTSRHKCISHVVRACEAAIGHSCLMKTELQEVLNLKSRSL